MRYIEKRRVREASGYSLINFLTVLKDFKKFYYLGEGAFADSKNRYIIEFSYNGSGNLLNDDGLVNQEIFDSIELIRVTSRSGTVYTASVIYADTFKMFTLSNERISIIGKNAQIFIEL